MGLMRKLFRRSNEEAAAATDVACPHTALTPRWDRSEDIGKLDRATGFRCESCRADFGGDDGRRLLQSHSAPPA